MDKPTLFPSEQEGIALLSVLVAKHPKDVYELLEVHGFTTEKPQTVQESINQLLSALAQKNVAFQQDLAQLLLMRFKNYPNFDSFSGIPVDPVSAVAGAVSSISNIFSQGQKNKQLQQQARSQSFANVLAYQQMKQQAVIDQQAREQRFRQRKQVVQALGIGGVVLSIGIIVYKWK
ncbi:MAG: hypothetical protein AAFO82_00025 [Bacteroidota bacterium]